MIRLMQNILVLDKLSLGVSYSTIGREFNVNESTIWNIQKEEVIF